MAKSVLVWNYLCGLEEAEVRIWENDDFNPCFEKFVFSVFPQFLLAIVSAFHFARHQHLRRRGLILRYCTLHVRLSICILIILSSLFLFAIEYAYNRKVPYLVYIIWGFVYLLSWLMHSCYTWRLHRLDHFTLRGHWSAVLAVLSVSVLHTVLLRTAILKRMRASNVIDGFEEIFIYVTTFFHVAYCLTLVAGDRKKMESGIFTSAPADDRRLISNEDSPSSQKCPEDDSWILPKLYFCWVDALMKKGYRKEIESADDIFELPEDVQTSNVLQHFYAMERKHNLVTIQLPPAYESERDPLSPNIYSRQMLSLHPLPPEMEAEVAHRMRRRPDLRSTQGSGKGRKGKSLLFLLVATFGWEYFPLGILKLFSDMCSFCNPIFLNLLILFLSNRSEGSKEFTWDGYLYCIALTVSSLLGSVSNTQYDYLTNRVSLKFRAVIVDAIYKKTLSVSSADLRSSMSHGEVLNLMSTDAERVRGFCMSFHQFWSLPVQMFVVLYLLYLQVGLAFLSGMAFVVLLIPINRWIAVKIARLSQAMMEQKDSRVGLTQEVLQGIKSVKFHVWEETFARKIGDFRSAELSSLKKRKYLDALCVFFWAATPVAISLLTFTTYVLMGNSLTAAKVFTSISLFAILIMPLNAFPWVVNGLMEAWVSLIRIQKLLDLDDLDPRSYYNLQCYFLGFLPGQSKEMVLQMQDVSFGWKTSSSKVMTSDLQPPDGTSRQSTVRHIQEPINSAIGDDDDELIERMDEEKEEEEVKVEGDKGNLFHLDLKVEQGMLVVVIGKIGSGKTSLLNAVLGEMRRTSHLNSSTLSLGFPLDAGFGYFSQLPWIQKGSIKDNILFGKPFKSKRFASVLAACALDHDLRMLHDGIKTLVGEGGVNLSGGQKARLALARTVYQNKKLYLLDDPYSSIDENVASAIHAKCTMGLIGHTTRILVTHHLRFVDDAHLVVLMEDGRIKKSGAPSDFGAELLSIEMDSKSTPIQRKYNKDENDRKKDDDDDDDDDDELMLKSTEAHEVATAGIPRSRISINNNDDDDDDDDELLSALGTTCPSHLSDHDDDEEDRRVGAVEWKVYASYWKAAGGCLAFSVLLSLFFMQASRNVCDWWLSYWVTHATNESHGDPNVTDQYRPLWSSHVGQSYAAKMPSTDNDHTAIVNLMNEFYRSSAVIGPSEWNKSVMHDSASHNNNTNNPPKMEGVSYYLTVYAALGAFNALATIFRAILFAYGGIRAAEITHSKLLDVIFKAPIKFFSDTSLGCIVNRFSADIFSVDDTLPFQLNIFLAQMFGLFGSVIICCVGLPFSALAILLLSVIYFFLQMYYRRTSRELKRLNCTTLSPIFSHYSETLDGVPIIRAHRMVNRFERDALKRLDLNQRTMFAGNVIVQWLNVRFQMIGVVLVACVSIIAVAQKEFGVVSPGLIGLAISYVLSITSLLGGVVLYFTETEKMMISMERVDDYINNTPAESSEQDPNEVIPPPWPLVGLVAFDNVTLRYGPDLPDVLSDVTFATTAGERIGVVGRTGSGKSTLFLALMRMVPTRLGRICIDGIDIQHINLREYRSEISVIPQDPFVFSGTIRDNLDPTGGHTDQEIINCLRKCHMLEEVSALGGLNSAVGEKGHKFSVGQLQLLCLTRAILEGSHILCIDEATANMDADTERKIRDTALEHYRGRTVITVAHRLHTIMHCDRVMVMSNGKLVEFDHPSVLQENPHSHFSEMLRSRNHQTIR